MTRKPKIRIGGASGFWGDSSVAAPQLVGKGDIDYLVFDYLAETTMAILAAMRAKNPELGYATDFVDIAMRATLRDIAAKGIKVVSNAGGINPQGCAAALETLARELEVDIRIAVVEGDDVTSLLPELRAAGQCDMFSGAPLPEKVLSANAYLGALPVARALGEGADIVITGRCVDSAVTLGPLIHEFGWQANDYDLLAAGSLAGHIIECGCQATGGLFTDWQRVEDWANIGYPIVECFPDGRFAVTKPPGTGGLIDPAAVAEQLLYEIGDPAAYILPDVVCDFRHVRIEREAGDRVMVSGAKGLPSTDTYKVSATYADGYRSSGTLVIVGIDAVAKARRTGEAILARTRTIFRTLNIVDYTATNIEVIGAETLYGPHARGAQSREVMLRVTVNHPDRKALEIFAREIAPAGTSWSPGTTGPAGARPQASPLIKQVAFTLPKHKVPVTLTVGGRSLPVAMPVDGGYVPETAAPEPALPPASPSDVVAMPLIKLASARSGDKGNVSNIGVIARRPDFLPVLLERLTPERVKDYFAHLVEGKVERFLLPGIGAMNFLLHEALNGGGPASMRLDPLGKGMAQMLLDMEIDVPAALARELEP
ncbi:acyclic terpene utilization AtuA family protein [Mesorhizobium sp. ZC-5]|uniref:acyclic terpene utilization AtuA family protein n=1 Tax=Mesorhizobium sp. ZC-5 TaxID=2986066 RepID=UPI0021E8ECD7|nr:acyclic terpene utilization AtuA family protein [Mesorhizobium sp. ZC-5]MCV3243905.1 DUF1446 domain-containing protein [Mesorhizobium sp. ZC-5]